jgi:hypothetical protein
LHQPWNKTRKEDSWLQPPIPCHLKKKKWPPFFFSLIISFLSATGRGLANISSLEVDETMTAKKFSTLLSMNQQCKVLAPVVARSKQYFFWLTLVVQVSLPHVFYRAMEKKFFFLI